MSNWISIKDKLPKQDYAVLIVNDLHEQFVGWLQGNDWHTSDCCECIIENVMFWRELPKEPDCEYE